MSLYLTKGAYSSPACTVRVTSRSVRPIEYNTYIIAYEQDLTIEGHLYALGPGNLSTAMYNLEVAMAIPFESIGVSYSGGQTQHWLSTLGSIGSVRIKDFKFMDTPLHMATEVKYSLTATAMYNNANLARSIVSLEETVSVTGEGGPDIVLASQAGAISVYQQVADYTDVHVIQSGKMTSRTLQALPTPLIVTAGARVQKASKDSISYVMRGTQILLYNREYSYTFNLPTSPGTVVPTVLT